MPRIEGLHSSGARIGQIIDMAANTLPFGFLACNGSAVSRTTYAELFGVIGTTYGVGDGSTTFNLPDAQGRALVGAGSYTDPVSGAISRTLGTALGAEKHQLSSAELASHGHGVTDPGHPHGITPNGNGSGIYNTLSPYSTVQQVGFNHTFGAPGTQPTINSATTGISVQSAGGDTSHNNMQPSLVVTKAIAYR